MHAPTPDTADVVDRALKAAHGLLPDQGPIGVFVHHNTLHALQHLPFHEAVTKGSALIGARTWPEMEGLRRAWRSGRIEDKDVEAELSEALGARGDEPLPLGLSRRALWRALMKDGIDVDDDAGIAFVAAEDPLFLAALRKVRGRAPRQGEAKVYRRHRDVLLALGHGDTDELIHPELVRLGIAFCDLGQAKARMPERDQGFLRSAAQVLSALTAKPRKAPHVTDDFARIRDEQLTSRVVLKESLTALGVDDEALPDWLLASALALPGMTGMFSRLERHPEEADAKASLLDFLAVRAVKERRVIEHVTKKAGLPMAWRELLAKAPGPKAIPANCDAFLVAGLARAAGKAPTDVDALTEAELATLFAEVSAFTRAERNYRLFLAFERAYRRRVLTGMLLLQRKRKSLPAAPAERAKAQVMFCIDEREESIRRALEELEPKVQTLGAAGFFGMAVDYKGLDDHAPAAYCPVVVTPAHEVHEEAVVPERQWQVLRARLRAGWHAFERSVGSASRTLLGGGLASAAGPLAYAVAVGRITAPRTSLKVWKKVTSSVGRMPATELSSLRNPDQPTQKQTKKPLGFSVDEAADRVTGLLKNNGLTKNVSRLVILLGHGSTSLNNPHESAHDCGACGGRRGGANARLAAELANRPDVREKVKARGVLIPEDTWFVGGLHDTASDAIDLYDTGAIPQTHAKEFAELVVLLDQARRHSARERCRRFLHAPLGLSPDQALAHVEVRSSHLGQPRPEYGHCTNAMAVVGRRELTRGLHLDRRAFLINYDPTIDENDVLIERILAAVGPVGAGINLEYWFSSVDNEVYGCGTKLPHNVTGLLGVINGNSGDLRTGLPLQMVELHEPVRLLLVVEASPKSLLAVAGRQPEVKELVVNRWVHLVSVDPESGAMTYFDGAGFVPVTPDADTIPEVERSFDWHGRSREFVDPAIVTAPLKTNGASA